MTNSCGFKCWPISFLGLVRTSAELGGTSQTKGILLGSWQECKTRLGWCGCSSLWALAKALFDHCAGLIQPLCPQHPCAAKDPVAWITQQFSYRHARRAESRQWWFLAFHSISMGRITCWWFMMIRIFHDGSVGVASQPFLDFVHMFDLITKTKSHESIWMMFTFHLCYSRWTKYSNPVYPIPKLQYWCILFANTRAETLRFGELGFNLVCFSGFEYAHLPCTFHHFPLSFDALQDAFLGVTGAASWLRDIIGNGPWSLAPFPWGVQMTQVTWVWKWRSPQCPKWINMAFCQAIWLF